MPSPPLEIMAYKKLFIYFSIMKSLELFTEYSGFKLHIDNTIVFAMGT